MRLLLVEHHAAFRQSLAWILEWEGFREVAQAGSLAEARRCAGGGCKDFEVVAIDPRLPDGDGMEFVRELRASQPGVAVLALTADASTAQHLRAALAGAGEVVGKDSSMWEILDALWRLVGCAKT